MSQAHGLDLSDSIYGQVVKSMKTGMQWGTSFPKY